MRVRDGEAEIDTERERGGGDRDIDGRRGLQFKSEGDQLVLEATVDADVC